jgi:dihydropteroate synthase
LFFAIFGSFAYLRHDPVTANPRPRFSLPLPNRAPLELGGRTIVMGIINVTPDSFADGGLRFDPARAIADGLQMVEDGADILDVGGESTRPGAETLDENEELRRVLPVVERLALESAVPVSIDTYKARVAREALDRGAVIVNDISGLAYDRQLGEVAAAAGAAIVLMHTRGRSRDMYSEAVYSDVAGEVAAEMGEAVARAEAAGIRRGAIVLDPGLGFAKKAEHTWEAIARLGRFADLGFPLLAGPSRKSYLTSAIGERPATERDWATAGAVAACVLAGAHIVRVHAVREMVDVVRVVDRISELS